MQNSRHAVAITATCLLVGACSLLRRSPESNAGCAIPPTIAVARWVVTSDSGVIEGSIVQVDSLRDPTPQPLANATVFVKGPVQRVVGGDSTGHFRLASLPPGDYVVDVRRIGFSTRRDSLRIGIGGVRGEIRLRSDVILFPSCCHSPVCL